MKDSTSYHKMLDYYLRTASHYDSMHEGGKHKLALNFLIAIMRYYGIAASLLDVGAGTGNSLISLRKEFPNAVLHGVEPSNDLRAVAYAKGISLSDLHAGNGLKLQYANNSYDIASAFGVLHHVRYPHIVINRTYATAKNVLK